MATLLQWRIVQIFRPLRFVSSEVATATPQERRLLLIGWRTSLFAPPVRVSPRGATDCRRRRNASSAQCPLRCLFSPNQMWSTPAEQQRSRLFRNSAVAQLLCRAWSPFGLNGKSAAENRAEKTRPTRHCVRKFGSFPRGQSTLAVKNQGDAANVAPGRIGSP